MQKKILMILLGLTFTLGLVVIAHSNTEDRDSFQATYPNSPLSALASMCIICHTSVPNTNAYGTAYNNAGRNLAASLQAIEGDDSDGDTFNNRDEIDAGTFPGNGTSFPSDAQAPTVDSFVILATSNTLTVSITAFTASDDTGVTGFMVTETANAPAPGDPNWSATAPVSFVFPTGTAPGQKTLFAWAKDAAGNVSTSRQATTTLVDNTSPTVTSFVVPAAHNTLVVPISAFVATDDFGVTGFLVRESDVPAPLAGDADWTLTAPASFEFLTPGAKTLFAWAKDAAGNISTAASASVTITLTTFADVPADHLFFNQIEAVAGAGITGGCQADDPLTLENEANFCPDNPISRGQMAVFLETSLGGITVPCVGAFADVPTTDPFCGFIELLANDGITGGCAADNPATTTVNEARFCPNDSVTRAQMAVFIEAALSVAPVPACTGTVFGDVTGTGLGPAFCGFIEDFATQGITGGCVADDPATTTVNEARFCPNNPVTRGQMAVFLLAAPDPLLP